MPSQHEQLSLYEMYIAWSSPKKMEVYEQAIPSGLPEKVVETMILKYSELEKSLGEIDRACGISWCHDGPHILDVMIMYREESSYCSGPVVLVGYS
ncbi:hypothetical protein Nepgr_007237 [Nepenthes gracilis]|uniref:Pre-mRNA-splicing factor Syf1/CRNKL1-like C-terminal HAT-repeats domain-containing protein n=1 Tax=Nepenthes gracilis TaxID=150966 RepID=A0AAD3XI33_NEPGR|nr:hypothetical protein Nepgr_007237 [Nepenthes gracilis]